MQCRGTLSRTQEWLNDTPRQRWLQIEQLSPRNSRSTALAVINAPMPCLALLRAVPQQLSTHLHHKKYRQRLRQNEHAFERKDCIEGFEASMTGSTTSANTPTASDYARGHHGPSRPHHPQRRHLAKSKQTTHKACTMAPAAKLMLRSASFNVGSQTLRMTHTNSTCHSNPAPLARQCF